MKTKTVLVLVTGLGSRYRRTKPFTALGPFDEMLMDYSIFDARAAGFNKVVFVVREIFFDEFKKLMLPKLDPSLKVEFVVQRANDLPSIFATHINLDRTCGTAHAIWTARKVIHEPFLVINAHNFYGKNAYKVASDFLSGNSKDFAVLGYPLGQTLSNYGCVDREICVQNNKGNKRHDLVDIIELKGIRKLPTGKIVSNPSENFKRTLSSNMLVSLNMFCLNPSFFNLAEAALANFLKNFRNGLTSELLICHVLRIAIRRKNFVIKILEANSNWFGIPYKADRIMAIYKIEDKIKHGLYPKPLFGN
jgi:UTP-glucose-1-phosphate uridylyltransferase